MHAIHYVIAALVLMIGLWLASAPYFLPDRYSRYKARRSILLGAVTVWVSFGLFVWG